MANNSIGFCCGNDDNARQPVSSSDCTIDQIYFSGEVLQFSEYLTSATPTSGTAVTMNVQNAVGGVAMNWAALEILPAAAGGGNTASPSKGAASLTGHTPLINPQLIHMGSDISAGGWTPSTGATLYGVIDESVASDADYIQSGVSPSHDVCEVKFASATDPVRSDEHVVRYRISSTSGTGNIDVKLYCGATLIHTWTHTSVPSTPTTFTQVLSGAEADSITDYTNLRMKFDAY